MVVCAVAATGASANLDLPLYRNAAVPVPARVVDLLGRITLAEKAGQLAMIHVGRIRGDTDPEDLFARDGVGAILSGAGETPSTDTSLAGWARGVNALHGTPSRTRASGSRSCTARTRRTGSRG